jgi:transcriptional regulator with XRE-family HTH domain
MSFGKKIKHYRKLRGLTQSELADEIGISQVRLSEIERGRDGTSKELMQVITTTIDALREDRSCELPRDEQTTWKGFGEKLQRLRIGRCMDQVELGRLLGIKRANVSAYETDRAVPPSDKLALICKIFSVSADYLLGLCETTDSSNS